MGTGETQTETNGDGNVDGNVDEHGSRPGHRDERRAKPGPHAQDERGPLSFARVRAWGGFARRTTEPAGRGTRLAVLAAAGFTLLELMAVVTIVSILVAVALPNYRAAILTAKEATLRQDLFIFRDSIDQYYADKGRYPASLEDLSKDGYLRKLPADPMTGAADWEVVYAEADSDNPAEQPGVYDVHSASVTPSSNGTPYNEW